MINSAFIAKKFNYTIKYSNNSKNNGIIIPIDKDNRIELKLNSIFGNYIQEMLQIKENLRIETNIISYANISNITYFSKYKKKNFFWFNWNYWRK